jgi:hypothetical protein
MDPNKICPVCGYDQLDEGPFTPEGCPTYEICPCCGFEYGFDDESEGFTYSQFRQRWIARGYHWFDKEETPAGWDKAMMERQLSNAKLADAQSRYVANIKHP